MKEIPAILISCVVLLFGCKTDEYNQRAAFNNDKSIIHDVMTKNLLFNKTYTLIDSISTYIGFGVTRTHEEQNSLIERLIYLDSIPSSKYELRNNLSNQIFSNNNYTVLTNKEVNEIFNESYIVTGKIDNYETLKKKTGTNGIVFVSNIYYSKDDNDALLGVFMQCGWNCGQNQIRHY